MDLAQTLHEQGGLDESEAFIDGMFSAAKGEVPISATPSEVRGCGSWGSWTAMGFPCR